MRQAGVGADVSVWTLAGVVAAGLSLAAAGCASREAKETCAPAVSGCGKPLVVYAPAVTPAMEATPSSDFVDQSGVQPALQGRTWQPMVSYYEPPVVQHGPLYFQDEFENVGTVSSACPVDVTCKDLAAIPYSDARWMLNTIALPVSMVVYPPWERDCSDGNPKKTPTGLTLDGVPCKRPVPVPFDLKCPDAQTAALAQLTGGPLPVTAPAPVPASVPATQPARKPAAIAAPDTFACKTITADALRQPCSFVWRAADGSNGRGQGIGDSNGKGNNFVCCAAGDRTATTYRSQEGQQHKWKQEEKQLRQGIAATTTAADWWGTGNIVDLGGVGLFSGLEHRLAGR